MTNPFRNTIVPDPWHTPADVREINQGAFAICCKALDRVLKERQSASVLLCGEAGSGKTHLLGRLRRHLADLPTIHGFVSIRLQAAPQRFWRHIRKCLIESLLRTNQGGRSQLERIFLRRAYLLCRKKRVSISELEAVADRIRIESNLSKDLCKTLQSLVRNRHRADAISWLKGHGASEPAKTDMGLTWDDTETEHPEDRARDIVHEICRLAGPTMPMVFCFDQIESLQRFPSDDKGIFAYGQAIASLHDETENALLISCIQTLFRDDLKRIISDSDFSRLAVYEHTLNPLTRNESLKLVSARLDACPELSEKKHDIRLAIHRELRTDTGLARKVLAQSASVFDTFLNNDLRDTKIPEHDFLEEEREIREDREILSLDPDRTDEIVQDAIPILANILDDSVEELDGDLPRDIDLVLKKKGGKFGISLCNHTDMKSLAARFRRLRSQFEGIDRLVVIRHSNRHVSLGAKKVRTYLDDLKADGKTKIVYADAETLAALEAVKSLLADAKAGDLANGDTNVTYQTVRDWLKINLKGPAADFIEEIFETETEGGACFELLQDIVGLLETEKVVTVAHAAEKLATSKERIESGVRRSPGRIGFLEGPPSAIFQILT